MLRRLILPLLLVGMSLPARAHQPPDEEASVRAAAQALLAERFPQEAHRLQVRVMRTGGGFDAAGPLRLRLPTEAALPRAHTQVTVLTEQEGAWVKAGWALLYVAHFDSVVVARSRVAGGVEVPAEQLGVAWLETTTFHGEPLRAADLALLQAAGPVFATRPLREGHALRRGDLRSPYAADTGEAVLLNYQRGTMVLRLSCKAREPGAVGDLIRVYAPSTGTTYRARLTGPGTADWVETL